MGLIGISLNQSLDADGNYDTEVRLFPIDKILILSNMSRHTQIMITIAMIPCNTCRSDRYWQSCQILESNLRTKR